MTHQPAVSQAAAPVSQEKITAALLEITGDLDKANVLQRTLPPWLVSAAAPTRQALEAAHASSQQPRERAASLLRRVMPLRSFCAERLKALLVTKGHAGLNVERDWLELPNRHFAALTFGRGVRLQTMSLDKHNLLQAAMQNFTQDQAEAKGLPVGAVIRTGAAGQHVSTLSVGAFARYCRELDLGAAYQRHLREVFNLAGSDDEDGAERAYNPVVGEVGQCKIKDMQIDLQIAHAKGDISESGYTALQALLNTRLPARNLQHVLFHERPLVWQGINVHGACLWSVLVFGHASTHGFAEGPLLVYMPGEPGRPWYEYPTLGDLTVYLTLKLQVPAYRSFFIRYLDEAERFGFFQRFDKRRTLERVEPVEVDTGLEPFFFGALTRKIQLDAVALAVPTAQVDEQARQKRLQGYQEAGLNMLNIAGLMVPVLGQLMLGVAVGEMLAEVFEGVDDWTHSDQAEGLEHLVNVAENLAAMALFANGVKVAGKVFRAFKSNPAEFFEAVEAVQLPDAGPRLWRRRLKPYGRTLDVDALTVANSRGIYQAGGHSYVRIKGVVYSVAYDARSGYWHVLHPTRTTAYRPRLLHNRQGGWRFAFEPTQEWVPPSYILTRLNPRLAALPPEQLKYVASIVDMGPSRLHALALQNRPLPERFNDCVARFALNQQVRDLIWQLEHQPRPDASTARVQLLALPLMPGWPQGRFFEVLDRQGARLERFPGSATFEHGHLSIHITEQALKDGAVMATLLDVLPPDEIDTLLGGSVPPDEQGAVLARQLLASLKRTHREVFQQLYQEADGITHSDHGLLKAHFPLLPNRIAWELLSKTPTVHRWQLRSTRRVPLSLAQRVREALVVQEEDQALIGLYLPELATAPSRQLAVHLLAKVAGWPQDLHVQVRRDSLIGDLIGTSGSQHARWRRTLVETGDGVQAFDDKGAPLGEKASGPDGFYQALLATLSPAQLAALNLSGAERASRLRDAIQACAEDERHVLSRHLWPERALPEPTPVPCVQAMVRSTRHPAALVRKVNRLYPGFDERQVATFLDGQGPDHLARAQSVEALERQFEALHRALKAWRNDETSLAGLPHPQADYRLGRHQAMQAIEEGWRQTLLLPDASGVKVPSLVLDGLVVGRLPTLPAQVSFAHVRQLSLNRMGLDDDVAYFLKHFKQLQALELRSNEVTRLPEVLSQMPALKHLYLNDNHLQLTEHTRAKLADLRGLQVLNLSNNPLIDPPAIGHMFELRELMLRHCRLRAFPGGVPRLPYLHYLDLRDNEIPAVPGWLFTAPRPVAEAINLRHNPLDEASRKTLADYRSRTGVGMGFLEDDIARLNEQKARELWLADSAVARYTQKEAVWTGLQQEPESESLFRLLAELGGTGDAQLVREDLERRVWRVLEAAGTDTQLRDEIFYRAATPLNCDDSAALNFSNLEVLVEIHEAAKGVEGGKLTAKPLLKLAKGLFRLDQLDSYARSHSQAHPEADPLEVSLAYRTGLASKFHLPGQPLHMRFARLGGVTVEALNTAEEQLRAAERSPRLLNYLVELPLWDSHLKVAFSRSFEALNEPFDQRLQAVFEKSTALNDADYLDQMNQILREQQAAHKGEAERLTKEALKLGDLSPCVIP
ncbi:MAG: hypothetical protein MUW57_22930 [Pseudomonas sp.]|nr:hypothetical protein [Pseudomonas sp.]